VTWRAIETSSIYIVEDLSFHCKWRSKFQA